MTPFEFQHRLRAGHGSAVKYVMDFGLDEVADLLLDACLKENSYDAQCEGNRARWLYQMFRNAPQREKFAGEILRSLRTAHQQSQDGDEADVDWYSFNQLCHLSSLLAQDGNNSAAQILREFVHGQDLHHNNEPAGCNALVLLDGANAAIELARRFGGLLQEDKDAFVDSLEELLEDSGQATSIIAELEAAEVHDPAIAAYMNKYRADKATKPQRPAPPTIVAKQVIEAALSASTGGRGYYFNAGRHAAPGVLEQIFEHLVGETNLVALERLLWVFNEAELPSLNQKLFDLAKTSTPNLRWAAIRALAGVSDPRVGALGRELLKAESFCADDEQIVYLFKRNLMPGDELALISRIQAFDLDPSQLHDFGFAITKLLEANQVEQLVDLANWLYESTPCSICRRDCITWLCELSLLTIKRAEECLYDANQDTRRLAETTLQRAAS